MDAVLRVLETVSGFVWGPFLLIPLLLLTGLYLTSRLRGLQLQELVHSLWLALVARREEGPVGVARGVGGTAGATSAPTEPPG